MKNSDLLKIAKNFGTPTYVYDASKIQSQYLRLTNSFSTVKNLRINYAVKALSNISVLKYIKNLGAGIDTVSVQEVIVGLKAGFSPEKIIYTPNGVSIEEIEKVAEMGVNINIDNLSVLEQFGSQNPDIPICIRINPALGAGQRDVCEQRMAFQLLDDGDHAVVSPDAQVVALTDVVREDDTTVRSDAGENGQQDVSLQGLGFVNDDERIV